MQITPRTSTIPLDHVDVVVDDLDASRSYLLLHGGGGKATVAGFGALLAQRTRSRVVVPTHPGFGGTDRPGTIASTRDLAVAYVALLDELGLTDVTVVGNSFGGWVAAEIALLGSPRLAGAVIVNGVGLEVAGHPITDVRGLSAQELRALSFHDPAKAPIPPGGGAGPSPDIQALLAYAGPTMADPSLADRLGAVDLPVRVIWGESDGIVDVAYGRAYADAIPKASFTLLPGAGHLPQVEAPEDLLAAIVS